jgi:integrase
MPTPAPLRAKITTSVVNALPPQTTIWDTELKGFCIRRQKSPAISYLLKLRVKGRIRWLAIGRHGQPWTAQTARARALALLANPALADEGKRPDPATITFDTVTDQFLTIHAPKLKPSTDYIYRCLIRTYLRPAFGSEPIASIARPAISAKHASWQDNPRSANHALAVLSKIMSFAEDQGYRPEDSNPCRRIQRFAEKKRERFLTDDELSRLGQALLIAEAKGLAGPYAIAAIRLLLLTGARLSEVLTLQWRFVDLSRRMIFLPDSKTGQKPITLNDPAIAVLDALPQVADNPYVIVGHRHGAHMVNLQKPWYQVRTLAKLPGVRLHDLRHTYASYAVAAGFSLPVLGKQLGHSQPSTTQRYSHLGETPVHQLSQITGQALDRALAKTSSKAA